MTLEEALILVGGLVMAAGFALWAVWAGVVWAGLVLAVFAAVVWERGES